MAPMSRPLFKVFTMNSFTSLILGIIGIVLALPGVALFAYGAWKIFTKISAGTKLEPHTRANRPWRRLGQVFIEVFGHTKFAAKPWATAAHWLVMMGFIFGIIVYAEAYIQVFDPAGGWPVLHHWNPYHFLEELLGIGTVAGIILLIAVRLKLGDGTRYSRFYRSNTTAARVIEAIVLIEGLGMLLVKASQIAIYGADAIWPNFLTYWIAKALPSSPTLVSVFAFIKMVSGAAFFYLVGANLTWGVAWHRFLAPFNIFFQRNPSGERALGPLNPMVSDGKPITIDNVEDDDRTGVGTNADASWKMLLDSATCTECGRCQDLCPAWNTEKPLSPKKLMMDLRSANFSPDYSGVDVLKLAGQTIDDDVLWSCTNCGACVDQCPVDIEHIDHVADLRRFRVLADAEFPSELGSMFTNIEVKGNPWGRNNSQRADWITEARRDGLEVPVFGEDINSFDDTEYLFWVGCAGAYDDAGRRTTRAVVELLHTAGVKFAVLSTGESCTGDPARRAGNEFLFQEQAQRNIETLDDVFEGIEPSKRKIITTCPHCFNTIRNEYPDFDGHYDVFHHTQLLNRLVRDGRLTPVPRGPENRAPITYHDPCFLGRHNQVYDPPRELLGATGVDLREMDRHHNEAFCCGAGGARIFMEEKLGRRINEFRTEQALATGASEIAVGCPFCNTMFTGGVKALEDKAKVRDVATMLRDSILVDGSLPPAQPKKSVTTPTRLELGLTPIHRHSESASRATGSTRMPDSSSETSSTTSRTGDTTNSGSTPLTSVTPPAAPAAPAASTAADPGSPATPAVPVAPSAPEAPAAPAAPKAPAAPAASPTPAAPAAPVTPAAPTTPAEPTAPVVPPTAPATPPAPASPSTPPASTAPAAPAPSAPPAAPAAPTPPAPAAPAKSAVVPAAPVSADTPASPAAPAAPTPPSAPVSAPATPKAPSTPAAPASTQTPPAPAAPTPPSSTTPTPPASPAIPKQEDSRQTPPAPPASTTKGPTPPTPPAPPAPPVP